MIYIRNALSAFACVSRSTAGSCSVYKGLAVFVRPRSHLRSHRNSDTQNHIFDEFQVGLFYPTSASVGLLASLGWLLDREDHLP